VIAAVLAAVISAAAVAAAFRQLLAVGRLRPQQPSLLEEAIKTNDASRVGRALDVLFPSGWSPALADLLLRGEAKEAAVAELNEQLGDVDRDLRRGGDVPRSAARIAMFAGVFGGIVELSRAVGTEFPDYRGAISALGAGLVGALVSAELGRRTRDRVGDVRSEWDRVATLFARKVGPLDPEPGRYGSSGPRNKSSRRTRNG